MDTDARAGVLPTRPETGEQEGDTQLSRMDRWVGLGAATALAVGSGILAAWLMPRGPATTAEAIGWLVAGLLLGLAMGAISATRWSIVLGAVAFTAAFELGRSGATGPTVDAVQLGSIYGVIAFVVGRLLTYTLALLPLALGGLVGVELAARRHRMGATRLGIPAWVGVIALSVCVVGLGALFLRPASTPAVLGANGEPVPGSIAELTSVRLGGHDQALLIRGRDTDAPVLLHLAGGPGGTDLGAMRADTSLEDDFVVVTWDQRGTGKSYGALDPVETLTPEQMVADTVELTEYLRERFDEERIYLHGNSWGSLLGVLAVDARPDLYHAWVGSGQMVSPPGTDRMFWEDTIAWAQEQGDEALVAALLENGPPPYEDILDYELALSHEHDWNAYPEFDNDGEMPASLFVPENTLMDQFNGLRAFLDTFAVLYPRIQDIDLRADAAELKVPVYVLIGAHEARGRAVLAEEWFELLEAPTKERVVFEHSGHRPSFEEPGRFAELMRRVRDETYTAE
ncbi:MAG: alpha/beta hydrolase [Candidatus Limnocylindrales bacterium]